METTRPRLLEGSWQELARAPAIQPSPWIWAGPLFPQPSRLRAKPACCWGSRRLSWALQSPLGLGQEADPFSLSVRSAARGARACAGLWQVVMDRGDVAGAPEPPKWQLDRGVVGCSGRVDFRPGYPPFPTSPSIGLHSCFLVSRVTWCSPGTIRHCVTAV